MSKFKVGDKVIRTGEDYPQYGMIGGQVYTVNGFDQDWEGGISVEGIPDKYWLAEYFEPANQTKQECPYSIIEELEAKIDNLEELISEQAAHIRELESLQDKESEEEFKPVREYTLEDWEEAIVNGWVFETRCGEKVNIDLINGEECNRPIICSAGWCHNINGMWDAMAGEDEDDIIRRIS